MSLEKGALSFDDSSSQVLQALFYQSSIQLQDRSCSEPFGLVARQSRGGEPVVAEPLAVVTSILIPHAGAPASAASAAQEGFGAATIAATMDPTAVTTTSFDDGFYHPSTTTPTTTAVSNALSDSTVSTDLPPLLQQASSSTSSSTTSPSASSLLTSSSSPTSSVAPSSSSPLSSLKSSSSSSTRSALPSQISNPKGPSSKPYPLPLFIVLGILAVGAVAGFIYLRRRHRLSRWEDVHGVPYLAGLGVTGRHGTGEDSTMSQASRGAYDPPVAHVFKNYHQNGYGHQEEMYGRERGWLWGTNNTAGTGGLAALGVGRYRAKSIASSRHKASPDNEDYATEELDPSASARDMLAASRTGITVEEYHNLAVAEQRRRASNGIVGGTLGRIRSSLGGNSGRKNMGSYQGSWDQGRGKWNEIGQWEEEDANPGYSDSTAKHAASNNTFDRRNRSLPSLPSAPTLAFDVLSSPQKKAYTQKYERLDSPDSPDNHALPSGDADYTSHPALATRNPRGWTLSDQPPSSYTHPPRPPQPNFLSNSPSRGPAVPNSQQILSPKHRPDLFFTTTSPQPPLMSGAESVFSLTGIAHMVFPTAGEALPESGGGESSYTALPAFSRRPGRSSSPTRRNVPTKPSRRLSTRSDESSDEDETGSQTDDSPGQTLRMLSTEPGRAFKPPIGTVSRTTAQLQREQESAMGEVDQLLRSKGTPWPGRGDGDGKNSWE